MNTAEEWRPIPGFGGWYEVSDMGRVRSFKRQGTAGYRRAVPRIRKVRMSRYPMVGLCGGPTSARMFLVHRLVLLAFRGEPKPGHEGSHLNGNAHDCRLENLAWESRQANNDRRFDHGTVRRGERHWCARLSAHAVAQIRASHLRTCELSAIYGVSGSSIADVKKRRTWRHLP